MNFQEYPNHMTLFRHVSEMPFSKEITLHEMHHAIQHGIIRDIDFAQTIQQIRTAQTKEQKTELKITLPAIVPTGIFYGKDDASFHKSSNYAVFDIDHDKQHPGWDIEKTLDKMKSYGRYVRLVFKSPSGNGIKIIAEHEPFPDHPKMFAAMKTAIEKEFEVVIDSSGSNLGRKCFLSHDPDAHLQSFPPGLLSARPVFKMPVEKTDERTTKEQREKPKERKTRFTAKDEKILQYICDAVNDNQIDITTEYRDWMDIAFALANSIGNAGRDAFHIISRQYAGYTEKECDDKFDNAIKTNKGTVNFGTLIHIAKQHGIEYKKAKQQNVPTYQGNFWEYKAGKMHISERALYSFLKKQGVKLLNIENNEILVIVNDNVVKTITSDGIRRIVKDYIDSLDEHPEIIETLHNAISKGASTLFSADKRALHFDYIQHPVFVRENEHTSFVFFKNGICVITKDKRELIPYKSAPGLVWDEWLLPHNFKIMHREDYEKHDWNQFLEIVCTPEHNAKLDAERYFALRWCIGHLCHNPKTTADKKLIHFCEDNPNMRHTSNGRTGKHLITYHAIKQIRHITTIPWTRSASREKVSFPMQTITPSTQVMHFGDVAKNYLVGKFTDEVFDLITDGYTVERKREQPFFVEPENAARMVSTGNAVPLVSDSSQRDRFFLMEIYSRFNDQHKPIHVFKRKFFESEWNELDWQKFFNTMLECIQIYIAHPDAPEYNSETLKQNQFETNTHPEWYDWIQKKMLDFAAKGMQNVFAELDRYAPGRDSRMLFAMPSSDMHKNFRDFCRERGNGLDVNKITPGIMGRWLELTPAMLNYRMAPLVDGINQYKYSKHKVSSFGGQTFHIIWEMNVQTTI